MVAWQDLKDLFREAGPVIRAEILMGSDRRPKGSGIVLFETSHGAETAICKHNQNSQIE